MNMMVMMMMMMMMMNSSDTHKHTRIYRHYTQCIVRLNNLIGNRLYYPDPQKHFFW